MDANFRRYYNDRPYTYKLPDSDPFIVISDSYRTELGVSKVRDIRGRGVCSGVSVSAPSGLAETNAGLWSLCFGTALRQMKKNCSGRTIAIVV